MGSFLISIILTLTMILLIPSCICKKNSSHFDQNVPEIAASLSMPSKEEIPEDMVQIFVSNQAQFNAAREAAQPGHMIIIADGRYDLGSITKAGNEENPIIFKAENNQGVIVTGFTEWTASHTRLWGMNFAGVKPPTIKGTDCWVIRGNIRSSWRSEAPRTKFWYCDCQIPNNENSRCLEFTMAHNATEYEVYKCYFHDSHNVDGNNFEEMVQCGFGNNNTNVNQKGTIRYCLFKNIGQGNRSSETIGIKGSNVHVLGCTYDNARSINVRHGAGNRIELCYLKGNSQISVRDADNLILNNTCVDGATIRVAAGDVLPDEDGGNSADWPAAVYPYAFHTLIYNNYTTTAPIIGTRFERTTIPAKNTVIKGHMGVLPEIELAIGTNPVSEWASPSPYPSEAAVELKKSDVGLWADL